MNKILHLNVVLTQLSNQIYHFLYLFFNNNNIFNLWYWNYSTFTNYFLFKIIKNIASLQEKNIRKRQSMMKFFMIVKFLNFMWI